MVSLEKDYYKNDEPDKILRIFRYLEKMDDFQVRFFITLTFRTYQKVSMKYKGLHKVINGLMRKNAGVVVIRMEETLNHGFHYHLLSDMFLSLPELKTLWKHGYIHNSVVEKKGAAFNYMLKGLTAASDTLMIYCDKELIQFIPNKEYFDKPKTLNRHAS